MFLSKTSHLVGRPITEELEARVMMSSTINISPGYQNETQLIQNALNSAGSGGTVNLGAGQYNITSDMTIPTGVTLRGNGNATLNWSSGNMDNMMTAAWGSTGTTITGVTFNGAGVGLDPQGSNLNISNNTFENISFQSPYFGNGLYISDVESNSTISGNSFVNITGNMGIYIFNPINVQITNNTFTNDSQAIKGQWFNGGSNDSISNNTLTGIYRFGIECQGDPNNLTVSGNWLGNWQQRTSHIGLSIATGEGNGVNITHNTILGTGISNPNTAYTAIEAMGNNLTIANNYAAGWGWAELVGYTNHWVTENNTWGVNTAVWVLEAGGTNPSVNTGNVNVPVNDFSGSAGGGATSQPTTYSSGTTTTTTTTSAPTTSTGTSSSTTTSTSTHTSGSSSLPSGWADSNIGSVGSAGSATYSNGVYTVAGAGTQVWGNSDAFNFAYQTIGSSTTVTARVTGSSNPNQYSKAGIMVRSSLNSNAANVYLYVQANGQIMLTDRSSNGSSTSWPASTGGHAPVWLRLAVSGNTVKAYYSTNGSSYTQLGTVTIGLGSTNYAGLAVSSNINSLDSATFDNVSI